MHAPERSPVSLSLVIPVRDEAPNIGPLLQALQRWLEGSGRLASTEVLVIDDGSADGTLAALLEGCAVYPWLRAVELRGPLGKSAALHAGFARARGPLLATIDGDLQDDPRQLEPLLAGLAEADVVVGRRTPRRDPIGKRVPSRIYNWMVRRVSPLRLRDVNCGMRAMRAEVIRACPLHGEWHRLLPVLAAYEGFRITERPVEHSPRRAGRSKYGAARFLRGFLDIVAVAARGRLGRAPARPADPPAVREVYGYAGTGAGAASRTVIGAEA